MHKPFNTAMLCTLDIDCIDVVNEGGGHGGSPTVAASGEGEGGGEGGDGGEKDKGQQKQVPDYKTQKTEIHAALQQRLKQGETW